MFKKILHTMLRMLFGIYFNPFMSFCVRKKTSKVGSTLSLIPEVFCEKP